MPFDQGSISFRQFMVIGQAPKGPDQSILDKLAEHAFRDSGMFEEVEYGWGGGEHLYDSAFGFDKNVFGECLSFALRVDTNKPSGDVVRAYTKIEEAAVAKGNPSGFLSKSQKREVRETIRQKVEAERKEGRYQKSRLIALLWDMENGKILANVAGANLEKLAEIFERTFGLEVVSLTVGVLAGRHITNKKFEELRPTRFGTPPLDAGMFPEYPWVEKTADPRGYLGDEFLLWAVWNARVGGKEIGAELFFDGKLELECAYGITGKHSVKGASPDQLPEVHEAMRSGKVPRKAGVTGSINRTEFTFLFDPELFGFGGTKLPEIEDADTARIVFEERIGLIRELTTAMEAALAVFIKLRVSAEWEGIRKEIETWIGKPAKDAAKGKRELAEAV